MVQPRNFVDVLRVRTNLFRGFCVVNTITKMTFPLLHSALARVELAKFRISLIFRVLFQYFPLTTSAFLPSTECPLVPL